MTKPKSLKTDFRAQDKWLTFGLALGPMSALTNLTVSYSLAPESCVRGSKAMLHVSFAVFLVLALAAAFLGWRMRREFRPGEDDLHERTHWLANAVIVLGLASAVLIVAMEIPNLILRSCD